MYVPLYTTWADDKDGLPGHSCRTESLIRTACAQRELVLYLAEKYGQPAWRQDFVVNVDRANNFPRRIAGRYGIDPENFVTSGNSFGVNADLTDDVAAVASTSASTSASDSPMAAYASRYPSAISTK